jgi:hypothetical protein
MATPQKKEGLRAGALTNLQIAQNMIEQALTVFESGDAEYDACLKALQILSKVAGKSEVGDLVPAQVARMVGQLPQAGGGTDMQRMIRQQMTRPQGQPQPQQQPGG